MKKFFLLLVGLFTFTNFNCSSGMEIASDICDITTEICHYASEICAMFPVNSSQIDSPEEIKTRLTYAKENLIGLEMNLRFLQKGYTKETEEVYKQELLKIRDVLRKIYLDRKNKLEKLEN